MRATISMILGVIRMLAEQPEEIAAEILKQYEAEKGEASEAIKAVFQLADIYRKEKAAAGTATNSLRDMIIIRR